MTSSAFRTAFSFSTVVVSEKNRAGNHTRSASGVFFRSPDVNKINNNSRSRTSCAPLFRRPSASRGSSSRPRSIACRAKKQEDAAPQEEELDFVTRMVINVFGKDALDDPEPMGLKRMTREEWPDQWWGDDDDEVHPPPFPNLFPKTSRH